MSSLRNGKSCWPGGEEESEPAISYPRISPLFTLGYVTLTPEVISRSTTPWWRSYSPMMPFSMRQVSGTKRKGSRESPRDLGLTNQGMHFGHMTCFRVTWPCGVPFNRGTNPLYWTWFSMSMKMPSIKEEGRHLGSHIDGWQQFQSRTQIRDTYLLDDLYKVSLRRSEVEGHWTLGCLTFILIVDHFPSKRNIHLRFHYQIHSIQSEPFFECMLGKKGLINVDRFGGGKNIIEIIEGQKADVRSQNAWIWSKNGILSIVFPFPCGAVIKRLAWLKQEVTGLIIGKQQGTFYAHSNTISSIIAVGQVLHSPCVLSLSAASPPMTKAIILSPDQPL